MRHEGGRHFGGGNRSRFGGGFRDRGRDDMSPKPVKIGQEYDVVIDDVGAKGDGIARVENFVVFVPGAKKGDHMRIRIKEVAGRFAIGEKISESSGSDESESEPSEEAGSEENGSSDESESSEESEEKSEEF